MTAETMNAVVLPGEGDYRAAYGALNTGYGYVEPLATTLKELTPHVEDGQPGLVSYRPTRVPTYEDIGRLWAFLDAAKLLVSQIDDCLGEMQAALTALDMARIEKWSA